MKDVDPAETVRLAIEQMLAQGLETDWQVRADDTERFRYVVNALRSSDGALESKLVIAGFTDHPVPHDDLEQACETCMYYQVHRRWCILPELDLPVRAEWSCNIWRV